MLVLFGYLIAAVTGLLLLIFCIYLIMYLFKKKAFPKKLLIATLSGLVIMSSVYIYEVYLFTFDRIDRESLQEGMGPITSPTDLYSATTYYEPYGGAAGGINVWVELTKHNDNDEKKIIYYSKENGTVLIEWVDEDRLYIRNESRNQPDIFNDSIELDVEKEIYHEKGFACKSWFMKNEYETCLQREN